MMFKMKLTGYEEIRKAIKLLPDNLKKQALRAGVRAGAKEIRDIARAKVPVKTGRLRKSITHKLRRGTRDEVLASVGWDYKKARYGHLVELGHAIVPRGQRGGQTMGHVPAYPHLRPALTQGKLKVLRTIRNKIEEWIYRRAARA